MPRSRVRIRAEIAKGGRKRFPDVWGGTPDTVPPEKLGRRYYPADDAWSPLYPGVGGTALRSELPVRIRPVRRLFVHLRKKLRTH